MNQEKPEIIKDGIQFWPIPATDKASIAFGVDESHYFHRRKLPNVPRKYIDAASELFFAGGRPALGEDVDWSIAKDWLRSRLCSYAPAHESKEATVGYALWVWSPECSDIRAKARGLERGCQVTPDEQNDLIHAQVDDDFPKPPGGFETDEEEREWREAREKRFLELCKRKD